MLNKTYVMPPERVGDVYIMQWAAKSELFNDKKIRILNFCRMYLHVTMVSELFDVHDHHILPYMYNCSRPLWFNHLQYMPIQQKPSPYQIRKVWKPFCDIWINQLRNATTTLGETTGRGAHFRSHRQTYQDTSSPG